MEDLMEEANEIQEVFSRSYDVNVDEDELQAGKTLLILFIIT